MNPFINWLMSPLSEWHVATLQHKLFVATAGGAMFWYLSKYKGSWSFWKKAAATLGTSYGLSMLLHAVRRFDYQATLPPIPPQYGQAPQYGQVPQVQVPQVQVPQVQVPQVQVPQVRVPATAAPDDYQPLELKKDPDNYANMRVEEAGLEGIFS